MAVRRGGSGSDVFDARDLGEFDESNDYSGRGGDDTLTGGGLKDTIDGGAGSDELVGDDGSDILRDTAPVGDDLLEGGAGDDTIEARNGADTLSGGSGDDSITFGFGAMLVRGGRSDDLFFSIGDATSSATVLGGSGDDVLDAGASSDVFNGGQGEDLVNYSAMTSGLVVNLANGVGGGAAAGDTFTLVEDVTGGVGDDVFIGDGAYNVLRGGAGDDTLGGGFGGDYLNGGDGFDVADLGAGGSTGVVANLETMTFDGGGADGDTLINFEGLAGSDLADALRGEVGANLLIGREGADTLNGAAGADTMVGGLGFDIYRVDDLGDRLVEDASAGVDTVEATIDFSLAGVANVENLTLIGPVAISGTGNGRANVITGSDFDNVLDGGAGADTMTGGLGDDSYYVDSGGDRIVEGFEAGSRDKVFASTDFNLATQAPLAAIERVTLTGTADIDFTSAFPFVGDVFGNAGDNRFVILNKASFTGGDGADTFYFNYTGSSSPNGAEVTDFVKGEDIVELAAARFGLSPGPLDPDAFTLGLAASDAEDRLLYSEALGELYFDRDGDETRYSPVLVAEFEPGLALRADDFVVV